MSEPIYLHELCPSIEPSLPTVTCITGQVSLLKENESSLNSSQTSAEDVSALREKVKRQDQLLAKCKDTIKANKVCQLSLFYKLLTFCSCRSVFQHFVERTELIDDFEIENDSYPVKTTVNHVTAQPITHNGYHNII